MRTIAISKRILILCIIAIFALVGCTGDSAEESAEVQVITDATPVPDPTPTTQEVIDAEQQEQAGTDSGTAETEPTDIAIATATTEDTTTAEEPVVEQAPAYNGPEWTTIELTNAVTGETFTLADFAGQAVFVHPMATWCTNCRMSQTNIRDNVIGQLNRDDYAFISLSVETSLPTNNLARYAGDNGFNWTFAVLTPDALAALVRAFGPSISNPPVQPHFIIAPDGTPSGLMTGNDSADEIINNLNATRGA